MKYSFVYSAALVVLWNKSSTVSAFAPSGPTASAKAATATATATRTNKPFYATETNAVDVDVDEKLVADVLNLKKVLAREYTTFFNPMETKYYAEDVSFTDPMTSLSGVQSYQNNVDMLASRTAMGKILFSDAGIVLHNVKGGEIQEDGSIGEIFTRWTLRLTAKILPWAPTARFSGISVYNVQQSSSDVGVSIQHQTLSIATTLATLQMHFW